MQKRILTIQDYSCLGRCSLTVALPTISACGIECVAIPTAVLSNHTKFASWTFADLTDEMEKIVSKWDNYNHKFNGLYTGYLATNQVPIAIDIINKLKDKDTLVYVDPAMADNGVLYAGFKDNHVDEMRELIKIADYIKPNITEACLLTGIPYPKEEINPLSFYESLVSALHKIGAKGVILTGLKLKEGKIGVLVSKNEKEPTSYIEFDYLDVYFHGTGDLFSSALVSLLILGKDILESVRIAHKYVYNSIKVTVEQGIDGMLYGPSFELSLPYLIKSI